MQGMRCRHDAGFRARTEGEVIKCEKKLAQLAAEFGVHPKQIRLWEKKALAALPSIFSQGTRHDSEG